MNQKNPKDLTRAVARASKVLRDAGLDVKHTQMLSAIAAFQGFSNREEFLANVKKAVPATAPTTEKLLYTSVRRASAMEALVGDPDSVQTHKSQGRTWAEVTATQASGLMPQLQLVELMRQVMDRLANGGDFNQVCEDTGISGLLCEQELCLKGETLVSEPKKAETFLERLLKMSPAEITHADFQIVLVALRRAFKELTEARGYEPGWMRPYMDISASLKTEAEKAAIEREYPYQVVSYSSARDWRQSCGEKLVVVRDLAEGIGEMRKRLDDNLTVYACALVSRNGHYRYTEQVRGMDGHYRESPDGLTATLPPELWADVAAQLSALCEEGIGDVFLLAEALEERICRKLGSTLPTDVLKSLGLRMKTPETCEALYAHLQQAAGHVQAEFAQEHLG